MKAELDAIAEELGRVSKNGFWSKLEGIVDRLMHLNWRVRRKFLDYHIPLKLNCHVVAFVFKVTNCKTEDTDILVDMFQCCFDEMIAVGDATSEPYVDWVNYMMTVLNIMSYGVATCNLFKKVLAVMKERRDSDTVPAVPCTHQLSAAADAETHFIQELSSYFIEVGQAVNKAPNAHITQYTFLDEFKKKLAKAYTLGWNDDKISDVVNVIMGDVYVLEQMMNVDSAGSNSTESKTRFMEYIMMVYNMWGNMCLNAFKERSRRVEAGKIRCHIISLILAVMWDESIDMKSVSLHQYVESFSLHYRCRFDLIISMCKNIYIDNDASRRWFDEIVLLIGGDRRIFGNIFDIWYSPADAGKSIPAETEAVFESNDIKILEFLVDIGQQLTASKFPEIESDYREKLIALLNSDSKISLFNIKQLRTLLSNIIRRDSFITRQCDKFQNDVLSGVRHGNIKSKDLGFGVHIYFLVKLWDSWCTYYIRTRMDGSRRPIMQPSGIVDSAGINRTNKKSAAELKRETDSIDALIEELELGKQ